MGQKFYLVRHGETALNADDRLRGLADPELDAVGEIQAAALGRALARVGASVVVSSPLHRATRTASVIATAAGIDHVVDSGFNDRDYGEMTGERRSDVIDRWGSIDKAPGVESVRSVLVRVGPTLDAWADRCTDEADTVIVVMHDAVISPLLAQIDPNRAAPRVATGSYHVIRRTDGVWSVVLVDQNPDAADES
ncbi:MAG: histidine phosphatase family protein [Rhodococcus sp. (in: high G+C Gram-positive bacteria)]|nr:histidine phosphatase family protein [Rhodococcus sp. (in: high G+C Gram-positive bacteria)]MDI6630204.1 histidine phosphatase family protein [Rhodococcus sp. (in: high G+C Gram-positive bacteria)]